MVFTARTLRQGAQVRAIDLLQNRVPERVYPVGRLDAESKGLLLLTNDGELTNRLTHPRYGIPRTYRATVDGQVSASTLAQLEEGVFLVDRRGGKMKKTGQCEATIVKQPDKTVVQITMREGVNRQVRRMLAKLGHKVRDLVRTRMGPLTLEGVPPGEFRSLTPRELSSLKKMAQRGDDRSATRDSEKPRPAVSRRVAKPAPERHERAGRRRRKRR